jgi:DNA-binding GntR family transcriptional regulator
MPAADARTAHRTKQEFVYHTIRRAILRCEAQPGERLVIEDLAQRLKVSSIPVREALQLLQSEGLVVTVPHVGATVAPLSRESIIDLFTITEGLQIVAARAAAERATREEIRDLERMVADMDDAVREGRLEEWSDLNTQFHVAIAAMARLPMLLQMTVQVFDRWDRTRRFFFRSVLSVRMPSAQAEHHAIVEAMARRAMDDLPALLRDHSQNALRAYLAHLDSRPDAGEDPASRDETAP